MRVGVETFYCVFVQTIQSAFPAIFQISSTLTLKSDKNLPTDPATTPPPSLYPLLYQKSRCCPNFIALRPSPTVLSMMSTYKVIILLLLATLACPAPTPLFIYSVSNSPSAVQYPVLSSLRGGKFIYIKAVGHNPDPSQNLIFVGTIPCTIPSDGVTDTFISCLTGDSGSSSDINGLPVTLIAYGTSYTTSDPNLVSYVWSSTPQLYSVSPTAGYGGQNINFYGNHKITNIGDGLRVLGDITKLSTGNDLCSRFDVSQSPLLAGYPGNILCVKSSQQEAGKYSLTEQLVIGQADHSPYLRRTSFTASQYFEFTALPTVTVVSPASGSVAGQYLKIRGNGFSPTAGNNSVTVDGNPCVVTSATNSEIDCTLAAKSAPSSILPMNFSSQQNGYFSGAGVNYVRYTLSDAIGDLSKFTTAVRTADTASLGSPLQNGYRADMRETDVYGSAYAQHWNGYFTPPVNGDYTFRGVADDLFAVYLSSSYGTTNDLPQTPLIYSQSYQTQNNFYINDYPSAEANVTLIDGKSYYLQAYHINILAGGHFSLEVDMPNTDTSASFQVHQVDYLTLSSIVQPQTLTYRWSAGTGSIRLNLKRYSNYALVYNVTTAVSYGCNATVFQNALNQFDIYAYYLTTVTMTAYDSNNQSLPSIVGAAYVDYVVSIYKLRPASVVSQALNIASIDYTGTVTVIPGFTHSPLITGTFSLSILGASIKVAGSSNIPYNVDSATLQSAIRNSGLPDFQYIEVAQYASVSCEYSCNWIIQYKLHNSTVSPLAVNGINLSGGNSTPTITATTRRHYSPNLAFDPLDYRYLNTPANDISVLVTTNGIPAICNGTCSYAFVTSCEVSSLSVTGSVLTLALHNLDPTNVVYTVDDISVSVGGLACTIDPSATTIDTVSCQLSTNTDTGVTPILVAGLTTPLVSIGSLGVIGLQQGVDPISTPLSVAGGLSATSGGLNGGILLTLSGSGFPLDSSRMTISICNKNAAIRSITNIHVEFYLPSCDTIGITTVTVTVTAVPNSPIVDSTLAFEYVAATPTAPSITSVNPTSANPAIKATLQIIGLNFGTDPSQVTVSLVGVSIDKTYQLTILSITDINIKAGLPGGLPGTYNVVVSTQSDGNTIGLKSFTYTFTVQPLSPTTGSYYGGTLLTIAGTNLSPSSQNTQVYIGSSLDSLCVIQHINTTGLTCRTPPISPSYTPGTAVDVSASTKLTTLSTCGVAGTCKFTYMTAASSPTLLSLSSSNVSAGNTNLTLTGANLLDSNNFAQGVLTNTITGDVVVLSSSSSSAVVWSIGYNLVSGTYAVKVRNAYGESNSLQLVVTWNPGTLNVTAGSTAGGIVKFSSGAGYPSSIDGVAFSVTVSTSTTKYPTNIITCCTGNTLELEMPTAADGSVLVISFAGPVNTVNYTFYYSTNSTPAANIIALMDLDNGDKKVSFFNTTDLTATINSIRLVSTLDSSHSINVNVGSLVVTQSGTSVFTSFTATLKAGSYKLLANTSPYGYILMNTTVNVPFPTNYAPSSPQLSFNGGQVTITADLLSPVSYITVNGFRGSILTYSDTAVTYAVPALVTTDTQTAFTLASVALLPTSQFTLISDQPSNPSLPYSFDNSITTYYSSTNSECWMGLDSGQNLATSVSRISFFANLNWPNVAQYILSSTFQGSNDLTSWHTLATVDQTVHSGWNTYVSADATAYRYLRFHHNSTSHCSLAEVQLYGIVYSTLTVDLTSQFADVVYHDGLNSPTFSNAVEYRSDKTAIVDSVQPRYGNILGGDTLILTGSNLDIDTATSVLIDEVDCVNIAKTATTISCVVGARSDTPTVSNSFAVTIGIQNVLIRDTFLYALKWSSASTWGVDPAPVDGDLVYVPLGMTLLVDVDTPILEGIAVQGGTLVFSDASDLVVQAGFITMNGGTFIAGTPQHPHTHQLTFIMHGDYYGVQQPMFGNKGIGCLNCKFYMYGTQRTHTWSHIAATINPTDTTFTLTDTVDWAEQQQIVVASTSFLHSEAERKTISQITGSTYTVDSPFQFQHINSVQSYGDKSLVMQAEVGLLTRNIKVMGSSDSLAKKYGAHLLLTGQAAKGFEAQVGYTEFMHCGQPQILGRYCIHFHMAGDIPTSFARGNAVHDSFARVITLHGVHSLTVENNVGYRVSGHNFFVQDGIQTHNVIRYNLAISSLAVTNMLQTDTSVASFWITNPTNDFYGNHAAGGDFYGIWYEIKANPDGPSATMDVCPTGNPLGTVKDNVAHSNSRFGLRVFQLQSRLYPCRPIRNDSNSDDPWADNPSLQSTFSDFTLYKNLQDGVLAQQAGNVIFTNFVIAQNYHSGIQFYLANFTKEPPTLQNSIVVGQSSTNALLTDTTNYTNGMSAAITGRSGVTKFSNVRFYNYPAGSLLFQTCRLCDDPDRYTNVGTEVIVQQLSFTQVNGKILNMINLKRDVIYDVDGSFSTLFDGTTRASGTIVHGFPHITYNNSQVCPQATHPGDWDNAVMCGPTVTIRRVLFTNIINHQLFVSQLQKAALLSSINTTLASDISISQYSAVPSFGFIAKQPQGQSPYTWSLPYITGKIYNIWWGVGIDFTHLSITTSPTFLPVDLGIIFRFNYTQNRELFQIGPMRGGVKKLTSLDYILELNDSSQLDVTSCQNGQYFHDNQLGDQRKLLVCVSGRNRTKFEYTEVNGVNCLNNCPPPAGVFVKESFVRKWSNASMWDGGVLPPAGADVVVNGNWTVLLDIDPNPLNNLTIDGTLVADDTRDVVVTANFIHIRAGNFTAGSTVNPFLHKLTFKVTGLKTSPQFTVDPVLAANKLFVVTGSLNLFGNAPNTVSTYLTQTALQGTGTLTVASFEGWAVGDTIVLSPSFAAYSQYQTATIKFINPNGTIDLLAPLAYTHYGSPSLTLDNNYGQLDTRTRVGHITRNIKITPGPDLGWGFSLTVYGYMDQANVTRIGSVQLSGVQLQDGGQLDTLNSPLVFLNLLGNRSSLVTATSFVNCRANCIYVKNAQLVTLDNNVLYNAWVFGAQFSQIALVSFTNNLIIGVSEKSSLAQGSELVACVYVQEYVNPLTDNVAIKKNFCLGSSQDGFALPFLKCSEMETNPYADNTVGSAQIGFILNTIGQDCQAFSYAKAFACKIGQISGPMGVTTLILNHFLMVDNGRSVTLKFGDSEGRTNHTAYLYNSYISAVSRPTCAECYGPTATLCSGIHGMRMLVPSANGESTPKKFNSGFDVVCKQPVYDSKSFIVNVTFDNFRQTYPGVIASVCGSNFVMIPHSSSFDQVGSAYIDLSKCTQCDTGSFLYAPAPSPSFLGWQGGCGDMICTGFNNYLVQDFNGGFLGSPGTIIPNNATFAFNDPGCTYVASMNAYKCTRSDFAVLEYQNVAKDFNTRIMWPVTLFYDGSNYSTVTNGWREWDWLGSQPQNHRFGRFVSLVKLNQTYNISFASQAPSQLQLQLQKRQPLGEKQNYIIGKIYYPIPNAIRVKVNGNILDPIPLTDYNNTANGLLKNLDTSVCGSNAFFYTNKTISFVVTAALDCLVTVQVTQSVQLTTHFSTDINSFFSSSSAVTTFLNNLCALFKITDISRVKVVGVFSGSIAITVVITPSLSTPNDNLTDINSVASSTISNGTFSSTLSGIGFGTVLSAATVYYGPTTATSYPSNAYNGPSGGSTGNGTGNSTGSGGPGGSTNSSSPGNSSVITVSSSKLSSGAIAGIIVGSVVGVLAVVLGAIYLLRRHNKVAEDSIVIQEHEYVQDKSIVKIDYVSFNDTIEKVNYGSLNEPNEVVNNESEIKIKTTKDHHLNFMEMHEVEPNEALDY